MHLIIILLMKGKNCGSIIRGRRLFSLDSRRILGDGFQTSAPGTLIEVCGWRKKIIKQFQISFFKATIWVNEVMGSLKNSI